MWYKKIKEARCPLEGLNREPGESPGPARGCKWGRKPLIGDVIHYRLLSVYANKGMNSVPGERPLPCTKLKKAAFHDGSIM